MKRCFARGQGLPKLRFGLGGIMAACVIFLGSTALADTDAEVNARKNALDVAGAFTNDGFKLRDGHWCGTVKPQDQALIAVNLFAGNQYWFAVGTPDPGRKVAVNVYNESGKLVTTQHYEAGEQAAAGFSPSDSGQYFVAVNLESGDPTNFCLIYSYK
ncbi:MAG: hypothetical protein JO354_03550 [Verrucomicrobia bacterium]|nr:hypothetical protein [Verrucomicrobiota bacterium]